MGDFYTDPDSGIVLSWDESIGKPREDDFIAQLNQIPVDIRKTIANTGYKKMKIGPVSNGDKGITYDCPPPGFADITISPTSSSSSTMSHEVGHALDDALGEQNGKDFYRDTDQFKDAFAKDHNQNDYYANNPKEFIGDVARAIIQNGLNNGDSPDAASSYTGLTPNQIQQMYPNSYDQLRQQIDFARRFPPDPLANFSESNRSWFDTGWTGRPGMRINRWWGGLINGVQRFGTDPLILDLDGNGIETSTLELGRHFDVGSTGFATQTAWVQGNDGILGIDRNNNGFIDDGSELIGAQLALSEPGVDSFTALREFDTNNDGKINSNDTEFSKLIVNIGAGGTKSLVELGIVEISLSNTVTNIIESSGNTQTSISNFTKSDGSAGSIGSYVLQQLTMDSESLNKVTISSEIAALPNANGYGLVDNLDQAMQKDTTGELKALVEAFIAETNLEAQDRILDNLIFRWTGSQNVPTFLPGSHMDGQIFASMCPSHLRRGCSSSAMVVS